MFKLRPPQLKLHYDINNCPVKNVLVQSPTGTGKTVVMAHEVTFHDVNTAVIAHRKEIVGQISLALARNGIPHDIIGSKDTRQNCVRRHMNKIGHSMVDGASNIRVISVDTLITARQQVTNAKWLKSVKLWVIDEAHHVLRDNKWGTAASLFTHKEARGQLYTATPWRTDGKGLGSHAHGLADAMVMGQTVAEAMTDGHLCGYEIAMPITTDLNLHNLSETASGDYSDKKQGLRFSESSQITGDIVDAYLKHAEGKRGITFAVNVEQADRYAEAFNAAGVPALSINGKSPDSVRDEAVDRLESGDLLQLVNVGLFGEGFDLPAVEVASVAKKTLSLSWYLQAFGRVLRPAPEIGKTHGIFIDHTGSNVLRHLLPDTPRKWTLDAREKRSNSKRDPDVIPLKRCARCSAPYERWMLACPRPSCGHIDEPKERTTPEHVDGDLSLLSEDVLNKMRGEIKKVNRNPLSLRESMQRAGMSPVVINSAVKKHKQRAEALDTLSNTISMFGGVMISEGRNIREAQKQFQLRFGTDVMTAQALSATEATKLNTTIVNFIEEYLK